MNTKLKCFHFFSLKKSKIVRILYKIYPLNLIINTFFFIQFFIILFKKFILLHKIKHNLIFKSFNYLSLKKHIYFNKCFNLRILLDLFWFILIL